MINILYLVLGAILLVAGRKLFWLLVGGIGFVVGATLATRFFQGNELTVILAGLVLGIIFAVLAIFLESVAIGIAGFVGGGYVFLSLAGMLGLDRGGLSTWIIFVVGGILGVVLGGIPIRLGAHHDFVAGWRIDDSYGIRPDGCHRRFDLRGTGHRRGLDTRHLAAA
jgi:hypothetical protein